MEQLEGEVPEGEFLLYGLLSLEKGQRQLLRYLTGTDEGVFGSRLDQILLALFVPDPNIPHGRVGDPIEG